MNQNIGPTPEQIEVSKRLEAMVNKWIGLADDGMPWMENWIVIDRDVDGVPDVVAYDPSMNEVYRGESVKHACTALKNWQYGEA